MLILIVYILANHNSPERRLDEERHVMEQRRKERLEMHLYMKTCVSINARLVGLHPSATPSADNLHPYRLLPMIPSKNIKDSILQALMKRQESLQYTCRTAREKKTLWNHSKLLFARA